MAVADFQDPADVTRATAEVLAAGDVHILVNNGGGPAGGPITEAQEDAFCDVQPALDQQPKLGQGRPSGHATLGLGTDCQCDQHVGESPLAGLGVSNTIRGAVANWAKTWATEVAIHGITVNNVLPGATHTARLTSLAEAKAKAAGTTPEAVLAGMAPKCLQDAWVNPRKSDTLLPSFVHRRLGISPASICRSTGSNAFL